MTPPLFLAELHAYDPSLGTVRVLRYASGNGFVTRPTDTPPNQTYDAAIKQPVVVSRTAFAAGTTEGASRIGYGDLVLINSDGALDGLQDYGFDGRRCVIRSGMADDTLLADFVTLLDGTMESVEVTRDAVTVKLRDRQQELAIPLQPTKYAGDNVLPDGLEGTADDLEGKPKPRCFGVVKNVSPPCVNTSKLIYQVNDGPVASIDNVYDRGIALGQKTFVALGIAARALSGDGAEYRQETTNGTNMDLAANDRWRAAVWAAGLALFVAVGDGGAIATSPDAQEWTLRTSGTSEDLYALAWSEDLSLLVVGGVNGVLLTSSDAATWTSRTSQFTTSRVAAAEWISDLTLFVIVGGSGKISTSSDGVTWTAETSGVGSLLHCVTWASGLDLIIAAGASGALVTSPDGSAWTSRTSGLSDTITSVAWASDAAVAVAGSSFGDVIHSGDAVSWSQGNTIFGSGTTLGEVSQLHWSAAFSAVFASGPSGLAFSENTYDWHVVPGAVNDALVGYFAVTSGDVAPIPQYGDTADLLDDDQQPIPGSYGWCPNAGYVRLGAIPAGQITADVTEGTDTGDRYAGRVFGAILSHPLGTPMVEYVSTDVEALDVAAPYAIGLWVGDENIEVGAALDQVAASVGAWWGVDRRGRFRIQQLTAPSGTPVLSLVEDDFVKGSFQRVRQNDVTRIPAWRTTVRYARNYTVQPDPAFGVSSARRAVIAAQWREVSDEDASVQVAHALAREAVVDTLLASTSNAQAEATRRQTLRGTLRHRYEGRVQLNAETEVVDLGDVVHVTHSRFGLSAGALFRVLGVEPDGERRRIRWTLWR